MKNWLSRVFNPRRAPVEEDILALQRELQALRVELESRQAAIDHLKQETERLRARQTELAGETAESRLESLFGDLAAPASQILTQAALQDQGKDLQSRDVLAVARRMVRALERHGFAFQGQIGQQVAFDPNQHVPLETGKLPDEGQLVTVRFAGVSYRGRNIHKAIVE
jgi:molecular chaperone GrpE (heat shock protein)